jgi:histone acetyltransferase (RNA polymerase elongator complex component)
MSGRPFIIPVFIPHAGCPRRCAFCNQGAVTGAREEAFSPADLRRQVEGYLGLRSARRGGRAQIAFFGGNFLGLDGEARRTLLAEAALFCAEGRVDGIRFSTRPDTVSRERLEALKRFPVQTVELGVQSMNDRVLGRSLRGHTAEDTRRAVGLLRQAGYEVGLQIMIGLPGDDEAASMQTGLAAAALAPDFVRIYPTLVLAGSLLAEWYREGSYRPLDLEEAVGLARKLLLLFRGHGIPVARMGLQHTEELAAAGTVLAGPHHPAFGERVHAECFFEAASAGLGRSGASAGPELRLEVHPRSVSRMQGLGRANAARLRAGFGFESVRVLADPALAEDAIRLPDGSVVSAYGPPPAALTDPS